MTMGWQGVFVLILMLTPVAWAAVDVVLPQRPTAYERQCAARRAAALKTTAGTVDPAPDTAPAVPIISRREQRVHEPGRHRAAS